MYLNGSLRRSQVREGNFTGHSSQGSPPGRESPCHDQFRSPCHERGLRSLQLVWPSLSCMHRCRLRWFHVVTNVTSGLSIFVFCIQYLPAVSGRNSEVVFFFVGDAQPHVSLFHVSATYFFCIQYRGVFYISVWKVQPWKQALLAIPNFRPGYLVLICAIRSINSHYFHIIGDGKLNPIVGVYSAPL